MLPNGGCSDGFKEELSRSNPYLNVTFEDGSIETQYINKQTILRTQYYECDKMLGLRAGEYTLFELRNVLGKCLISTFLCIIVIAILFWLDNSSLLNEVCSLTGYTSYFFKNAFFIWTSVISYHLWMTLTSLSRNDPENRFLVYSAFAWIPAVLFTGIIFVVNKVWENDPHYWNWMPSVGFSRCVLVGSKRTLRIFINGPLIVIGIFNWTMFILTARYIRKVKKDLKYFRQRQDGTLNCLEFDGETCSDGFEEELSRSNPYLNVTFKDGSVETQYITNQTLMRTRNYDCDEMLGLNAGEYTLFEVCL
ncbi:probable G-protein coupled receptor Mth-like 7 [Drosophila eugracilis]|uniref:probable G-protein coupled receptor Mth-like 7 n=1 Tax=Drosophila eugracilis TaxID=29029 RepID=UPI001BDA81CE|nr:probable G-protein coupled receptor Mth-like 7 [Drosophila eugracilis]